MKMRAPAVPLITVDPYFSIWSYDALNERKTFHWTGKPNTINGTVTVDGEEFSFCGENECAKIEQIYCDVNALVTDYAFSNDKIMLQLSFFTPLFADDLYRLSRPVSYLKVRYENADGSEHNVRVKIAVSEEICLDTKNQFEVSVEEVKLNDSLSAMKIGSKDQPILEKQGDDLRIDWGYFYLCGPENCEYTSFENEEMTFICTEFALENDVASDVAFAYDDIHCLEYFNKPVDAYWKKDGKTIEEVIVEALAESDDMLSECRDVSETIFEDADRVGGEKYAELLSLAYRQIIAAHKLALDENGEIIFISKECFSNGCAATVDVTYPSAPFFLLYNTELLKGMLRPVFRYAATDDWEFDFAPHDAGTYPLVNGQRYGWMQKNDPEVYLSRQMPVEECGNMIILTADISLLEGNTEFADKYSDMLSQWVKYLIKYGEDPENQLCTDDFAGHLAHNCNLSLKAIMGIAGYGLILRLKGNEKESGQYLDIARKMADKWTRSAANDDGSFRLAFDKADSFSMKYNIVWDKIWNTELFAPCVRYSEFSSNKKHINPYGMPLDSRRAYTKSDWLVWTACLAPTKEEFEEFIEPLWKAYNVSDSRVPMTDWYDTNTAGMIGFRHRTVQGGLFIKLLEEYFRPQCY